MKKNIVIFLLAIISIGLVGYIVYDKYTTQNNNDNNNDIITNEEQKVTIDEAIKIGENIYAKYLKLVNNKQYEINGKNIDLSNWLNVDNNNYLSSNINYIKIDNFEDKFNEIFTSSITYDKVYGIMNKETDKIDENVASLLNKDNNYYIDFGGRCTGSAMKDLTINVSNIETDRITYQINFTQSGPETNESGEIVQGIYKFSHYFVLVKENSIWKIAEVKEIPQCGYAN